MALRCTMPMMALRDTRAPRSAAESRRDLRGGKPVLQPAGDLLQFDVAVAWRSQAPSKVPSFGRLGARDVRQASGVRPRVGRAASGFVVRGPAGAGSAGPGSQPGRLNEARKPRLGRFSVGRGNRPARQPVEQDDGAVLVRMHDLAGRPGQRHAGRIGGRSRWERRLRPFRSPVTGGPDPRPVLQALSLGLHPGRGGGRPERKGMGDGLRRRMRLA